MSIEQKLFPTQRYPEGVHPTPCPECTHDSQIVYWRCFTKTSFDEFIKNDYRSTVTDFDSYAKPLNDSDRNRLLVNQELLNSPGNLWTTPDPSFALSMGFTRGILEEEPIYMLGINHCKHTTKQGVQGYRVFSQNILVPLTHTEYDSRTGLSDGTIFNAFSAQQVRDGVFFQINPIFLDQLGSSFRTIPGWKDLSEYFLSSNVNSTFSEICFSLNDDRGLLDIYTSFLVPLEYKGRNLQQKPNPGMNSDTVFAEIFIKRFKEQIEQRMLKNTCSQILLLTESFSITDNNSRMNKLLFRSSILTDQMDMNPGEVTLWEEKDQTEKQIQFIREQVAQFQFLAGRLSNGVSGIPSISEICLKQGVNILPWLQQVKSWIEEYQRNQITA